MDTEDKKEKRVVNWFLTRDYDFSRNMSKDDKRWYRRFLSEYYGYTFSNKQEIHKEFGNPEMIRDNQKRRYRIKKDALNSLDMDGEFDLEQVASLPFSVSKEPKHVDFMDFLEFKLLKQGVRK